MHVYCVVSLSVVFWFELVLAGSVWTVGWVFIVSVQQLKSLSRRLQMRRSFLLFSTSLSSRGSGHPFAIMAMESTSAAVLSAEQLAQVLVAVKEGMRDEIQSLRQELNEDKEAAEERLVKRARLEKGPTFKRKSNEKQFEFNSSVSDKLTDAEAALEKAPKCPAVDKAKALITEGNKALKYRQKLIRIADRSEHGWAAVEEYVEDELADGEDDEKRIQRSDFRAGRKLKAAKGAKGKKFPTKRRIPPSFNQAQASSSGVSQLVAALLPAIGKSPTVPSTSTPSGKSLGPCFYCGKPGHFRRSCPLLLGTVAK